MRQMATVLIVEDEDQLRRTLTLYLAHRGFTVAEADTVETAIEALQAFTTPFDAILLDINLSDGTGWDVLRYLQAHELAGGGSATTLSEEAQWQPRPRVIVMTAVRPAQCRLDEFRPAALLLKPFPIDVLMRLLDRVLARQPYAEAPHSPESAQRRAGSTSALDAHSPPAHEADVPLDDGELDVEDAFGDGDHDIEYWVRHGNRLVPATDDEVAQIHEWERESAALARLALLKRWQVHSRSRLARLMRGIASVQQRFGHSPPLLGSSGNDDRQCQQCPPAQPTQPHGYDEHMPETAT